MRPLVGVLATLVLIASMSRASYGDCDSGGHPALGIIQVTGGTADSTVYLDDRNYALGNGLWTYHETNGLWAPKLPGVYLGDPLHADLQRGENCCDQHLPEDQEICADDPDVEADWHY